MGTTLPNSDSLRRAALQASWQRGRWVSRRRVIWRWATWGLVRIGLPLALLVAVLTMAAPWLARLIDNTPSWMSVPPPTQPKPGVAASKLPEPARVAVPRTATPPTPSPVPAAGSLAAPAPATAPKPTPAATTSLRETAAQEPSTANVETKRIPGTPGLRMDLNPSAPPPARTSSFTTNVGDKRP